MYLRPNFLFRSLLLVSVLASIAFGEEESKTGSANVATSFWGRHLEIIQVESVSRFNYMDTGPHSVLSRDLQYRIRARAQVKLTESGSTYVEIRAENGQGFDNSWNNLGIGKGPAQGYFTMKSLFLGQKIGSHVELQAGGIEFDQGAGTQRSYASGDGYLTGYRAVLDGMQEKIGFDHVSFTAAYVGDFDNANVFPALRHDMNQVNYLQLSGKRSLGESGEASAEIDSIRGIWFTREALHWRRPVQPLFHDMLLEVIARTSDTPRFGYAASVSRFIDAPQRWQAYVIYTQLPYDLFRKNNEPILLPQGEIDAGKRISFGSAYFLTKRLQVGVFAGRLLDGTPAKRYVAQMAVGYDYTKLVSRLLH